ncbi:hypothetical protein SELMODRAFT_26015, partial [Selaginella moellendorffii]
LEALDLSCNMFISSNTNICLLNSRLESLVLVYNRLHGPVLSFHCDNLQMLDLSLNSMTGSLPEDICSRLPKLQHLILWGNNLEGRIPPTIGDCSELVTLHLTPPGFNIYLTPNHTSHWCIDISFNSFTGTIPTEFCATQNLYWLNLAHNLLTGAIPSTMGNLKNIEWLDLSQNQLESQIPGSLADLTFLKYFNISHNRLLGGIPQAGQLPVFPASSYEGNPGLCGIPLAECQ